MLSYFTEFIFSVKKAAMRNETVANVKRVIHNVHLAVMVATVVVNTCSLILLASHYKLRKKHAVKLFLNLQVLFGKI